MLVMQLRKMMMTTATTTTTIARTLTTPPVQGAWSDLLGLVQASGAADSRGERAGANHREDRLGRLLEYLETSLRILSVVPAQEREAWRATHAVAKPTRSRSLCEGSKQRQ